MRLNGMNPALYMIILTFLYFKLLTLVNLIILKNGDNKMTLMGAIIFSIVLNYC